MEMDKLPKIKELKAPEGYFETLPNTILSKTKQRPYQGIIKYAAAAVILLSLGLWQYGGNNSNSAILTLDDEALLYIESNQWTAEDVLSLSDDPNAILDEIIFEELTEIDPSWSEEDWF